MSPNRSLFCDSAMAEQIERAEAQLMAACTEAALRRNNNAGSFHIPLAGGVASFAETGSPFNKVAGLGFDAVPTAAALVEIERAFAARGSPVQVELANLADPAIGIVLSDPATGSSRFENVLGLALDGEFERVHPAGIEIRRSGDEEFEAWLTVVADGAAHPDAQGVPWHEEFPRDIYIAAERDLAAAGVIRYVAVRDGSVAGGAGLRLADGIAQFAGAATAPAHYRGIQSALLPSR